MMTAALLVNLLLVQRSTSFGLCDIINVISEWGCSDPDCTYDFTRDGKVDLLDIVFIVNGWTGDPSCGTLPEKIPIDWTVIPSPAATSLCENDPDLPISVTIQFSGETEVENFIVQGDAPRLEAEVVDVTLTSSGQADWTSANCEILTGQGFSYFSCSGGGTLRGNDVLTITYRLRALPGNTPGRYRSEITTFPPVSLKGSVDLNMICGRDLPTTTSPLPTTAAPSFNWQTSLEGSPTICGTDTHEYTGTITVLSGIGFPFVVGSGFIRGEGLFYSAIQSSISGMLCQLHDTRSSFSCEGAVGETFTVKFKLARGGPMLSGTARLTFVSGFLDTNQVDQFASVDITYSEGCTK